MNFFDKNIKEIADDKALRLYGVFLSLCHLVGVLHWIKKEHYYSVSDQATPLCWPFFPNCYEYRFFDPLQMKGVFIIYAVLSIGVAALFLNKRLINVAYWSHIFLNIFKTIIYFVDFRLRKNQHYMLFFVSICFLFLPFKRNLIRYLIVFFYFSASFLKYNMEWITGAALYDDPFLIHGKLIPIACVYVVILETFIVWGILFKNRWVFWLTFFQLVLFHVLSWGTVGFFYPLLMFALISIYPMARLIKHKSESENLMKTLIKFKQPHMVYVCLMIFMALQLFPMVMPGDAKITGEGRLYALHMFDAKVACEGQMTLKNGTKVLSTINIPLDEPNRIRCDPAVYFSLAKYNCWEHREQTDFELDIYYNAKRAHEHQMRPLVNISNFCSQKLKYSMIKPNDWIIK